MAWTWKKRYTDKNGDTVASSTPSVNNTNVENPRISETMPWKQVSSDVALKEAELKQHAKVAEEAVAGWEKAEAEAESVKTQLEFALKEKAALQDRLTHLDAALKDCTRQVRLVREDQEQKRQELLQKKNKEVEKIRAEYEAKLADVGRQLLEAGAENKVMAITLQEHVRTVGEVTDAKSRAEAEIKVLQHRIESLEKDKGALKYEVHVLNKQIQIRNDERDYNKRDIEALNKQHSEDVKTINKMEAECQKLRILVRRKLPGPNALAQMKIEAESLDAGGDGKRRFRSSPDTHSRLQQNGNREIELLVERLLSMEEETKMLKEALAQRNGELHSSRLVCAKTATKLSAVEAYFDSVSRMYGLPKPRLNGLDADCAASVVTISETGTTDDEVSRADAWASALIAELSQFRKDKPPVRSATNEAICSPHCGIMDDFADMERLASDLTCEKTPLERNPVREDASGIIRTPAKRNLEHDYDNAQGTTQKLQAAGKQADDDKEIDSFELQSKMTKALTLLQSLAQALGLLSLADTVETAQDSEACAEGGKTGLKVKLRKLSQLSSMEPRPALREFVEELPGALEILVSALASKKIADVGTVRVIDCETQTCDVPAENKLELELVRIEKNALQLHMKTELTRLTAIEAEMSQLKSDKLELQKGLDAGSQELEASKAQLRKAQALIKELETKISLSVPDGGREEESMVYSELEAQTRSSGALMQDAVSRLEKELEEEYKKHEQDRNALEQQQSAATMQVEEAEDGRRLRKEEEIAEAEVKLAECQRTILALGKQLKALSTPRDFTATSLTASRANSSLSVIRNFSENEVDEEVSSPKLHELSIPASPRPEPEANTRGGARDIFMNTSRELDEEVETSLASPSPLLPRGGGASSPARKTRRSSFSRFFRAK